MMLGVSGSMGSSADGAAAPAEETGGGLEESGSGGGGNRWPRQETLTLLKIRSDMDAVFRDSNLKGPLWEEVSRKMAELGFQRNAKKCKEKFENVYKYHKRTKDGRASKSDGTKTYRFFDQLEALENTPPPAGASTNLPPAVVVPPSQTTNTVPSIISPNPVSVAPPHIINNANIPINSSSPFQPSPPPPQPPAPNPPPPQSHVFLSHPHIPASLISDPTSSSSTSSDEDIHRRGGKKRKWKDFFQRLMEEVVHKQEELQKKFLDTLERRERERMAREESWRVQEMARMSREHELLVQERSIAATKDAAVIAFLQKVTEEHNFQVPIANSNNRHAPPPPQQTMPEDPPPTKQVAAETTTPPTKIYDTAAKQPALTPAAVETTAAPTKIYDTSKLAVSPAVVENTTPPTKTYDTSKLAVSPVENTTPPTKISHTSKTDNGGGGGGDKSISGSSSRWPKAEVEALIKLRTNLDTKYQENVPKGPLWEEISAAMAKLGYNRSSKRCKEKWENINKYFKKVKESNKKRPEDSKTCPYFHQLDAIYRERAKTDVVPFGQLGHAMQIDPMAPIMAEPEQQWPPPGEQLRQDSEMPDYHHQEGSNESENMNGEDEDEDEDEEDEGGGYEIVANNKQPSNTAA